MEQDQELLNNDFLVVMFPVCCTLGLFWILGFAFFFVVKFMNVLNIYMIWKSKLQKDSWANLKELLPVAVAGIVWAAK